VYRFLLYPFSSNYLVEVIITSLWLIPEMYKLEKRTGTIKFLWLLLTAFTVLPGIVTVIVRTALGIALPDIFNSEVPYFYCRGMTGWVVGLIFWSYLQEDPNNAQQDRM
jgi:membrane associated rhomboid family serine protease